MFVCFSIRTPTAIVRRSVIIVKQYNFNLSVKGPQSVEKYLTVHKNRTKFPSRGAHVGPQSLVAPETKKKQKPLQKA